MANSTTTIINTMEWAKKFNFARNTGLSNYLEPAKTSANLTLQTIISPPFVWRWNRVITGFYTAIGVQDYTLINWSASTAVSLNWLLVDTNGNSQQVTVAGTTGSSQPSWNTSVGGTTSDNTVTWKNLGPVLEGNSTFSFGWIETASVQDPNNTGQSQGWIELTSKLCLALDSEQARPRFIAGQIDSGNGNITFRLMPAPDQVYPINITLQQKAGLITSLNGTWSPIPDEYSYIYSWGFMALMWMFSDDPRFNYGNQKFITHLLGANQGLTQTERDIFLGNWQSTTGQPLANASTLQQGNQARGGY